MFDENASFSKHMHRIESDTTLRMNSESINGRNKKMEILCTLRLPFVTCELVF